MARIKSMLPVLLNLCMYFSVDFHNDTNEKGWMNGVITYRTYCCLNYRLIH